ncbi:MAG: choice-of-anchor B family protein [Flavobacteriales bacterium]|nr:choice-of-anchor B family protein [Flavobacteriales bacterium]
MKKSIIFTLANCFIATLSFAQFNTNLLFHWEDTTLVGSSAFNNTYNEIWGVEINGAEIAIIGSTAGTHFFDVSNPATATEVAFVAGAYFGSGVIHRDYHDFDNYLYVVCDEGNTSTLQIMDISNLPNSVSIVYDSNILFTKSHNIFIDTATAKLYVCAVKHTNPNNFNSAMEVYSLANPVSPTLLHTYNDVGHVHDAYVRNDTAYLNCGNEGLRIIDFSMIGTPSPVQPNLLASLTSYPDAGYNHSGWLNDDGTVYVMLDENHGYDIKLLDVSDFNNISVLSTFNSGVDSQSMAHNAIIKEGLLFVSYYHDGLRVFNIVDPTSPFEVLHYDTYLPNSHASYKGAWGVYPFWDAQSHAFSSILVSDMQTGLYVFSGSFPLAINNLEPVTSLVFPNPAENQFTIGNKKTTSIVLYDVFGKKVLEKDVSNNKTIKRGNISSGMYFYSLKTKEEIIENGKIIFE